MLRRHGPDATVWATDLNSYAVRVDETTGDILVNSTAPRPKTELEIEIECPEISNAICGLIFL
jgi:hypothetical protein